MLGNLTHDQSHPPGKKNLLNTVVVLALCLRTVKMIGRTMIAVRAAYLLWSLLATANPKYSGFKLELGKQLIIKFPIPSPGLLGSSYGEEKDGLIAHSKSNRRKSEVSSIFLLNERRKSNSLVESSMIGMESCGHSPFNCSALRKQKSMEIFPT
ncbi:hypothetical protein SAY86_029388 [Trapa natans]|uniref:Uncharacterized protein n=1 Tax=Trapa natans TaxID=22666 RepID=A0AAN7MEE1_TRANT|nr:hypothetical protein SAY86_029388 [Trapa natans]